MVKKKLPKFEHEFLWDSTHHSVRSQFLLRKLAEIMKASYCTVLQILLCITIYCTIFQMVKSLIIYSIKVFSVFSIVIYTFLHE